MGPSENGTVRRSSSFYEKYDYEPLRNPIFDSVEIESSGNGNRFGPASPSKDRLLKKFTLAFEKPKRYRNGSGNHAEFSAYSPQGNVLGLNQLHPYAKYMLLLAFFIGLLFGYDVVSTATNQRKLNLDEQQASLEASMKASVPRTRATKELLGALARVRTNNWNVLYRNDFGPFRGLVLDKTLIRQVFVMNDISRERLLRKIMIRILEAQTLPLSRKSTFTWVTAGDSAAASHGNMYSQSYTAVLEQTVKQAFDVVGIQFVAKNRATSDIGSAPELALCQNAIYGHDADILSWDFGRTDRSTAGQNFKDNRVQLWAHRATMHINSKPILVMMDSSERSAWSYLSRFEEFGVGTILMDELAMGKLFNGRLPDSLAQNNLSHEDIPVPIRYLMCNGYVEGNQACDEPSRHFWCDTPDGQLCQQHKYNTQEFCPNQHSSIDRASWNPGWKQHLFVGRLIGFALIELLNEALAEIQSLTARKNNADSKNKATEALLNTLKEQEQAEHRAPAAADGKLLFDPDQATAELFSLVNPSHIYNNPAICRTALLPSQAALMFGLRQQALDSNAYDSKDPSLKLVFDSKERLSSSCEGLKFDFKDYFVVRAGEDVTTQFPTQAEIETFTSSFQQQIPRAGLIVLCPRQCLTSNNCHDKNVIQPQEGFHVTVDGIPVTRFLPYDTCFVLAHADGPYWSSQSGTNDQHTIGLSVTTPDAEIQISSIVLL